VDIIGNVVNNLPIIGPIRQQIVKEFKKNLDVALGSQVKGFLASFNRVAVQRMVTFILSPENTKSFSKANRGLVENIISRPTSSFFPDQDLSIKFIQDSWLLFYKIDKKDVKEILDIVYSAVEDKTVSDYIDIDEFLKSSPTALNVVSRLTDEFLNSPEGRNYSELLLKG